MKLRYYLRGLGIGMLVAALVLILSGNTGGSMSDEEVKSRAAQLGLVEKDKSVLDDIGKEDAPENAESDASLAEAENGDVSEKDETGQDSETDAASEEGMQTSEQENEAAAVIQDEENTSAQSEEQTLAEEIEQKAEEVAERAEEVAENSIPVKTVTFVVVRGDTSISVARRAQEMGLVASAADFDLFLCQNGYDRRISIGSYEIPEGAAEKEIADIVTKSK